MGPDERVEGGFEEYLDQGPDPMPERPPIVEHPRRDPRSRVRVLALVAVLGLVVTGAAGAFVALGGDDSPGGTEARGEPSSAPETTTATTVAGIAPRCVPGVRPATGSTTSVVLTIGNCSPGITEIRIEPVAPAPAILTISDLGAVADPGAPAVVVAACVVASGSGRCTLVPAAGISSVALVTVGFAAPTQGTGAKVRVVFVARSGTPAEALVSLP